MRYLGRKAELPQMLRGVAQLPPEQRGAVGKAANQARQALEALIEQRGAQLGGEELQRALAADRVDVTLPGAPPQPVGRLHLLTTMRRELEDIFLGLGFTVMEGPEIESVHYNFDALNHSPTHPARARTDTFYVARPDLLEPAEPPPGQPPSPLAAEELVLRTHTSPMQVRAMEAHPPPLYVVIPGRVYRPDSDATHTPQFHQIEGLAVDEDITLADLKGTLLMFARAVFGDERDVRLRPHFFPFTEPSVEVDVSCFHCDGKGFLRDGSRCYLCKGEGWLEVLGAGEVDPNVYSHVPTSEANAPGYDPEKVQGFAWGMGVERIAMLKHGVPDLRLTTKTTSGSWTSSDARPADMAARILRPALDVRAIEQRLTLTGTKVEAIHHHGVRDVAGFVVGHVLDVQPHPDADRLRVCTVDLGARGDGRRPATIVCGAPNVAAGQTVAVARPGAVMPDGTKLKRAKLRGVVSEGMILAENELEIGTGGEGHHRARRAELDAGRGVRAGHAAGRRAGDRHRRARAGDHAQPARTASASTASRASCTRRPARRWRPSRGSDDPGSQGPVRRRRGRRGVPRPVPALHRARVRERHDRTLAAVAEGAPDGRRAAPDQQRRRHHQLRDAADRPAAARLRPRPRRRREADRAPRARRRAGADARRPDARAGRARWS